MRLNIRVALVALGLVALVAAVVAAIAYRERGAAPGSLLATGPDLPPPPWTADQLRGLLAAVDAADAQGLRSADYGRERLAAAIDGQRLGDATDAIARRSALDLAHDYALGRIRRPARFNWYIDRAGPDEATLSRDMERARADGRLDGWLEGLLPADPGYAALRGALAATPDGPRRDRILANLERHRWLPRDFGRGDTLYVNLPSYRLQVRHDGVGVASYDVVIGATDMPTPALSAPVERVVVNPAWIVPASIVRKSHIVPGAKYQFVTLPNGKVRVRQKPGPGNALGKVKIDFPNKLAIYFHDTPSRSLFARDQRTFSHGCVRVRDIDRLAASLVRGDPRFGQAFAGDQTRNLSVPGHWRAEIVYLTLVPGGDGTLADLGDPYGYDAPLAAALTGRKAAPRPVAPPTPPASAAPDPERGLAPSTPAPVTPILPTEPIMPTNDPATNAAG